MRSCAKDRRISGHWLWRCGDYWGKDVLPAYKRFVDLPNRENALNLAQVAWNLHDRMWHSENPGVNPRDDEKGYKSFRERLFQACPELSLVQDVAESIKHTGLSRRSVKLKNIEGLGSPGGKIQHFKAFSGMEEYAPKGQLDLVLHDGTRRSFTELLERVIDFWKAKLSVAAPPPDRGAG